MSLCCGLEQSSNSRAGDGLPGIKTVMRQGVLIKIGDYHRKRYFVLTPRNLKYYEHSVARTQFSKRSKKLPTLERAQQMEANPEEIPPDLLSEPHGSMTLSLSECTSGGITDQFVRRSRTKALVFYVSGRAPDGAMLEWTLQAKSVTGLEHWIAAIRLAARPPWQPNGSRCQICEISFTFMFRRHHCRQCGGLVCKRCIPYRKELSALAYDEEVYVCRDCNPLHLSKEELVLNTPVLVYGKYRGIVKYYGPPPPSLKRKGSLVLQPTSLTNTDERIRVRANSASAVGVVVSPADELPLDVGDPRFLRISPAQGRPTLKVGEVVGIQLNEELGIAREGLPHFLTPKYRGIYVSPIFVDLYSEKLLAANIIKSFLRCSLARQRTLVLMNQRVWNALDSKKEDQSIQLGRTFKRSLSLSSLSSLARREADNADASDRKSLDTDTSDAHSDDGLLESRGRDDDLEKMSSQAKRGCSEVLPFFGEIEDTYQGVRLSFPLTDAEVKKLMKQFIGGTWLHRNYAYRVLADARELFERLPTVLHLIVPEGTTLTIVGDLHGQLDDLFTIFSLNGTPSSTNWYLFNGDYVDRGAHGVEVFLTILCFKLVYPHSVWLNRGNHECRAINHMMGFEEEVSQKFGDENKDLSLLFTERQAAPGHVLFDQFQSVFDALPLCTLIGERIFVCHGGLFSDESVTISDLERIDRLKEVPHGGCGSDLLFEQLLWSDPRPHPGTRPSQRGAGVEFGEDITCKFVEENGLDFVVRSHECVDSGIDITHAGRLITVFSASYYCGIQRNQGAYIHLDHDLNPTFHRYFARPVTQQHFKSVNLRQQSRRQKEEIMALLNARIVPKKPELYMEFCRQRQSIPGTVSGRQWAAVLKKLLKLDLPYMLLASYYMHDYSTKYNPHINFSRFLDNCRIGRTSKDKLERDPAEMKQHLLAAIAALGAEDGEQLFDLLVDESFDPPCVTYMSFVASGGEGAAGLSKLQVYELFRSLDTDMDAHVSREEILRAFYEASNWSDYQFADYILDLKQQFGDADTAFAEILGHDKEPGTSEISEEEFIDYLRRRRQSTVSSFREGGADADERAPDTAATSPTTAMLPSETSTLAPLQHMHILRNSDGTVSKEALARAFAVIEGSDNGEGGRVFEKLQILRPVATVFNRHRLHLTSVMYDLDDDGDQRLNIDQFFCAIGMVNVLSRDPIDMDSIEDSLPLLASFSGGLIDIETFIEELRHASATQEGRSSASSSNGIC